jgi:hypothetical protein
VIAVFLKKKTCILDSREISDWHSEISNIASEFDALLPKTAYPQD